MQARGGVTAKDLCGHQQETHTREAQNASIRISQCGPDDVLPLPPDGVLSSHSCPALSPDGVLSIPPSHDPARPACLKAEPSPVGASRSEQASVLPTPCRIHPLCDTRGASAQCSLRVLRSRSTHDCSSLEMLPLHPLMKTPPMHGRRCRRRIHRTTCSQQVHTLDCAWVIDPYHGMVLHAMHSTPARVAIGKLVVNDVLSSPDDVLSSHPQS